MRFLFPVVATLLCAATAAAQTVTATFNANVTPLARLSVSTNSLSFPDADPDVFPLVAGSPDPVSITAKARGSYASRISLTVLASDNLRSGVTTIPASAVTWTASGAGFVAGTLSATTAQTVAAWTGSGVYNGSQRFTFKNLWTYPSGTYTLTMVYTLSAP